jgi:hypothetical protein
VVTNLPVPYNAGNFLIIWELVSFSRRTVLNAVSKQASTEKVCIHWDILWQLPCSGTPHVIFHNLYEYEMWSHTLWEEQRLNVFEDRMMMIFVHSRTICNLHHTLLRWENPRRKTCAGYVWLKWDKKLVQQWH